MHSFNTSLDWEFARCAFGLYVHLFVHLSASWCIDASFPGPMISQCSPSFPLFYLDHISTVWSLFWRCSIRIVTLLKLRAVKALKLFAYFKRYLHTIIGLLPTSVTSTYSIKKRTSLFSLPPKWQSVPVVWNVFEMWDWHKCKDTRSLIWKL